MSDPYSALERTLEMQLDVAYHDAAMGYISAVRSSLARFNLKRHRVMVDDGTLKVAAPVGTSWDVRWYWELRRGGGRFDVIDAIYQAGDALDRLPKEVQQRLSGAIIIGER